MTSAKKERRNYYLYYTIMFMVSMAGASLWFFANNKSFVWSVDGLTQHYNALAYYGEYLRKIVRELWDNKRLVIPLYNFSLGYGADIFTTLQYYIFGDPLNLLSVFVQPEHTEYLYAVLMFIRMYLAGIAFSIYARSRKKGNKEVLLGCMVYLFSEYALYFFCQQPFFINPMIFFPLLLLAVDRIYEGKKPYLYIVMITVSAVSNLYFFYMMGILMVLYAVFRYFDYHKKMNAKIIFPLLGRFFLYSMLGICMAAAFILPFVNTILSSGRFQTENYIPILYGLKYYMRLFSGFIMMDSPGYHTLLGFPAIAFLSVSLLLLGKEKKLKSGFVLLSLFLIFPFFGHIFNGASYVTNRWVFVYAFLVAYIVTEVYPLFEEMDSRQKKGVWLFAILESAACLAGAVGKYLIHYDTKALVTVINLVILIVMTGFLCSDYIKKRIRIFPAVFCLTFIGILINAYDVPREEGNSEFVTEGEALESLKGTPTAALKMYQDENTIWRYGENGTGERKNSALQTGLNGTSFYWSLANPYVADFQRALYLNEPLEHSYKGADKRSIMEVLSGVKYYMVPTGKRGPESYKKLDTVSSDGKKI